MRDEKKAPRESHQKELGLKFTDTAVNRPRKVWRNPVELQDELGWILWSLSVPVVCVYFRYMFVTLDDFTGPV